MPSTADLRRRLRRAGVKTGDRHFRSASHPAAAPATPAQEAPSGPGKGAGIEALTGGQEIANAFGTCFLIEETYPLDHPHGPGALGDLLRHPAPLAAEIARDPALADADLRRLVFLDIETTGLGGGAGTFAFLVGLGLFEDRAQGPGLRLRQYFLRDPAEEKAMLAALLDDLAVCAGLVTFNGRTFDLPLIDARLVVALRHREGLSRRPHLDLLHPARRLWRGRLASCALSSLETHALQVERTGQDVPGALIPGLYLDYLRSGDAREMLRVIYHNAVDILSLVSLATHLLRAYARPPAEAGSPAECLALARWHELEGHPRRARAGYRQALAGELSTPDRITALTRLAASLKRAGRRPEAVPHWETLAGLTPDDPRPCEELAKYYEWEVSDLDRATGWTRTGLKTLTHWKKGWRRDEARAALEHRLNRLQRKLKIVL